MSYAFACLREGLRTQPAFLIGAAILLACACFA